MSAMERILSGVSQSFQTGASMLGLCSWHIYPDILVLGDYNKDIKQNDSLVPGGTIATLGLQDRKINESKNSGVFWSLPLAYLRFYGDPIQAIGCVEQELGLTVNQLMQVALGSFLGQWTQQYQDFLSASQALVLMSNFLSHRRHSLANWLKAFGAAAQAFISSKGLQREEYSRLLKSGRRRYPNFLANKRHWTSPYLGLTNPNNLLTLTTTVEDRISILRRVASRYGKIGHRMVIRYFSTHFGSDGWFECATVLPVDILQRGRKRDRNGIANAAKTHLRWLESSDPRTDDSRSQEIHDMGEVVMKLPLGSIWEYSLFSLTKNGLKWKNAPLPLALHTPDSKCPDNIITHFDLVLGDPTRAALYIAQDAEPLNLHVEGNLLLDEVQHAFRENYVCNDKFAEYLINLEQRKSTDGEAVKNVDCSPTICSARALSVIAEVYNDLQDARLAIKVADKPLHKAKWVADYQQNNEDRLSYAQTFACIANLESGFIDIDPDSLKHVMALSSGNSIYIAAPLLHDPAERCNMTGMVKRVVGNVGRAGIAMLTAPRNPRMRSLDHDTWNNVNHNDFDGKFEDNFHHTTLHLSFTDWEMPIDIGAYGARDREVFFLEAPISVHHRGEWIADIDILSMISSPELRLLYLPQCLGHGAKSVVEIDSEIAAQQLVAIDSWDELLDIPLEIGVVRAYQNWQARLAATTLSVQRGYTTVVMPASFCWQCYLSGMGSHDSQGNIRRGLASNLKDASPGESEDQNHENQVGEGINDIFEGRKAQGTNDDEYKNMNINDNEKKERNIVYII